MNMKSFEVRVPASTANLGPGFDCLGCALNLYLKVRVIIPSPHLALEEDNEDNTNVVQVEYSGDGHVPCDESNLIVQSCLHLIARIRSQSTTATKELIGNKNAESGNKLKAKDLLPHKILLQVDNKVPLARGLGSSATAIVAGVLIANELCQFGLSKSELFNYILELESHPDNVGACLFGGAIVGLILSSDPSASTSTSTTPSNNNGVVGTSNNNNAPVRGACIPIAWPRCVKIMAVIPQNFQMSTEECRKVLPNSYSRSDVVSSIQRVAALTAYLNHLSSIEQQHYNVDDDESKKGNKSSLEVAPVVDAEIFSTALLDCVHQPYRFKLIPGLQSVINRVTCRNTKGLLGIVLSGAGPTILVLYTDDDDDSVGTGIAGKMRDILVGEHQLDCDFRVLDICKQGATISTSSTS